jgi:hypothetical protein
MLPLPLFLYARTSEVRVHTITPNIMLEMLLNRSLGQSKGLTCVHSQDSATNGFAQNFPILSYTLPRMQAQHLFTQRCVSCRCSSQHIHPHNLNVYNRVFNPLNLIIQQFRTRLGATCGFR